MRAALRISNQAVTADEFEPAELASDSGSGSTAAIKPEVAEQPKKKWVNLALASILTLAPVNIPLEMYSRRYGAASTMDDWFQFEDDSEDYFLFPGGIFSPSPERKILFRKVLRLEGLERRKPYLNF
jgi:hypothetical protein